MARPMIAADSAPPALTGDTVLYPAGGPQGSAPSAASASGGSAATWVFMFMAAGLGGGLWFWNRRRRPAGARRNCIQIEDTKSLGNRQFLVVASCDGKRFLLGVASGGIRMLSHLDDSGDDLDEPV
jgi:flagellar protein FliO/FliZ